MPLKILCHVVSSKLLQYFTSLSDRSLHESIFKPHFRLDQIEDKNLFKIFDRRLLPVLKCFREHREKKKKQICRSDVKGNRAGGAIRHVRLSNRWQEILVLPPRETWSLNLNWESMKCAEPKCEIRAMVILYFSNLRS